MTKTNITARIAAEFGPSEGVAEVLQLLNPFFPQPELHDDGQYYFTPDEVKDFDALFERFGLSFRSTDARFDDINFLTKLWFRLVNGFGSHIECSVYSPKLYEHIVGQWPAKFREYLLAVMSNNRARVVELARELKVEDLTAEVPAPMFGGKKLSPGRETARVIN